MNILVTICARGGSKGIPSKNIKLIAGKPLIGYAIDTARHFADTMRTHNVCLALSTDSDEIAAVAASCGLVDDYRRPEALANDSAGKVDAISDVLRHYEIKTGQRFDYVLDLDVTSPLRTISDLTEALAVLQADENALNIFSVSEAGRNPYFNVVEKQSDGYYREVKQLPTNVLSRQSAPTVYDINGSFYIYRRRFFDSGLHSAVTPRTLVYVMQHICFDLDRPIDFEFMQYLIENNKLGVDRVLQ